MAKFFIDRPIVAMVISILVVIVGLVAMAQLPIAQYPNIAPPEMLLTANYPGADAVTLEQSVATPLEQQMSGVDNMLYMNSTSQTSGNEMNLRVSFDITTDPNIDQVLVNMRYSQASSQLPPEVVNQGVTVKKSVMSPLALFVRSEEHTSELQSQSNLVCRLLLEKKKKQHDTEAVHADALQLT